MAEHLQSSFWARTFRTPLRARWLDVDGVTTRVVEAGQQGGPVLVLLHGVGGHLESFTRNIASLAVDYRVVLYDFPGHGWSSSPDRSYEVDGYCQHLVALLDELDVELADLVGQSLGGWVAARFATTRPDRVGRLVLVGTGGTTFDPEVMRTLRASSLAATESPTRENIRKRLEWLVADPSVLDDEIEACRRAIYARPGATAAMEKTLVLQDADIRRKNLLPDGAWKSITQPTLVIWGDQDRTGPVRVGADIASLVPNSELVVFDTCGHWPQFEQPDRFNRLVLDFLRSHAS